MTSRRRFFKRYGNTFGSEGSGAWLMLDERGDYDYRNPDSVYIHRWDTFRTQEEALDWLDRCVSKSEQPRWRLFHAAASVPGGEQ